jgi:hypothetical protein
LEIASDQFVDPSGLMRVVLDSNHTIAYLQVSLRFNFTYPGRKSGTYWDSATGVKSKKSVESLFIQQVESTFNNNKYHIVTGKNPAGEQSRRYTTLGGAIYAEFSPYESCTCREMSLRPQLELKSVASGGDFTINVFPGKTPPGGTQSAQGSQAYLFENSPTGLSTAQTGKSKGQTFKQNVWAHEFGHLLGLDHPGHGVIDSSLYNKDPDYDADAPALMGRGNELRPQYFQKWADLLSTRYIYESVATERVFRIYKWSVE